jgi:molybdopterin biosynthesis enzyme
MRLLFARLGSTPVAPLTALATAAAVASIHTIQPFLRAALAATIAVATFVLTARADRRRGRAEL